MRSSKMANKKILITGGAGYIGQNLISFFLKEKCNIYAIDNLSTSRFINKNIKKKINFYKIDLKKEEKVKTFFGNKNFDLIIHLAAFSGVQEFNKNILKNFNNNVLATKNLVRFGCKKQYTKFIFASSAAVYGKVSRDKISENTQCNPKNYYGLSKYVCENIIQNQFNHKKIHYAILRYFNVVGSIVEFKIEKKINSLLDIINNNIKKNKYKINIHGKKLNTKDGTPERDFIHIYDLCRIHKKIYPYLNKNKKVIFNCGSGTRYSVLQIIREFEKSINQKFKISYKKNNLNETQTICSNINLLKKLLKINIEKNRIKDLISDYL
jgi:UDP-glucose 4-epimerase